MLNILLMLLLSFESSSISTTQRSEALFANPAGLGINMGLEAMYMFQTEPNENSLYPFYNKNVHSFSMLLGNSGIGFKLAEGLTPALITGTGIGFSKLWFGYSSKYQKGYSAVYTVGTIFRPFSFISFGASAPLEDTPDIRLGVAIRPLTDRVTLFYDATSCDNFEDIKYFKYGLELELINGINIKVENDKNEKFSLGAEISFGNIKVGGSKKITESSDTKGEIIISNETYRHVPLISKKNRIVDVEIRDSYPEMKIPTNFFGLTIGSKEPKFYNLLCTLEKIKERKDISTLVIKFENHRLGLAQREEIRKELLDIKKSGKKIVTVADEYSLGSYYLASVADYIVLHPLGYISIPGIAINSMYLKGTLEKLGIETDVVRVGKYKSATEIVERKDMSEEDREQLETFLDDLWEPIISEIARARKLSTDSLERIINKEAMLNSEDALKSGLVDTVIYNDELEDFIKKLSGGKIERANSLLKEKKVLTMWGPEFTKSSKIALLIAEGSIVTGKSSNNWLSGEQTIGSETLVKQFKSIEKDNSIKAVVFRINSGGGDGFASEEILRAVKKVSKKKPVIVSMGNVAGSGGYYIACQSKKILADNFTLTGSIGVFGMNFILKGLYEKIGITHETIKRGEHADGFSGLRHLTPEEQEKFQREVSWFYDNFTSRVAEGRNMSKAAVDSVGQGRIWSGTRAKTNNLIDETCGLLKAIEIAKQEAGIKKDSKVVIFPQPGRFF